AAFLEIDFDRIVQAIVASTVSREWNESANAVVPHERDNGLSFAHVVWTKAKDIVARNGKRGSGAALADDENVMGISVRLDHRDLGARLRSDDNLHAAFIEVLNGGVRLGGIELRVADE